MSNTVLKTDVRNKEETKKNASRRLRAAGYVPAVVYGLGQEPLDIKINTKDFKDTIKGRSLANLIFDLKVKVDGKEKKETTLIKEIQKDPISSDFLHIDFIRIEMKKEVEAVVPIHIINEEGSAGVKEDGGVIQHGLRELRVQCLPTDIPESIEYDIIDLHLGSSIKVSDIKIADNVKILSNPEEVVVSVIHPTHLVVEEIEAVEGEEAEAEPELVTKGKEAAEESRESKED